MGSKTIQVSGFPINASATFVKNFLENYTGDDSVLALKVRKPKVLKPKSRAYAIVQFLTGSSAEKITHMAQQGRLTHGGFRLMARTMERDIILKPRTSLFVQEETTLYIGSPISRENFSVLWSCEDVTVNFGFNMRKICFTLSMDCQDFKLELSYESIWDIQLHYSVPHHQRFLLIQLQAAPRIYEMLKLDSPNCQYDYFLHEPDDQWIRTTDFTGSSLIGQSSAFCLQLPKNCDLPNIREYFVYYEEVKGHFKLESGSCFSRNLDLVPIVEPPRGSSNVPYKILFKINHMVQNGTLMGMTLDQEFFYLVSPENAPVNYIERALENMSYLKTCCFDPANWLKKQYEKFQKSNHATKSAAISLDSGLFYVHRVQVTPCKVYFDGPEINVSNRVIRHYSEDIDNFIRVSFVDEDGERMFSTDLSPRSNSTKRTEIYRRILSTLKNGISIGDKKFEFLAFSSSQLRENSAWMFASRTGQTAADIRKWMGSFSRIRNVAKYAARLGQSFGSSTETLTVGRHEVEVIPDIENSAGYLFSDGIGKISADFAHRVSIKCGLKSSTPSAFQIRYGGYKGVVAIDPTSSMKLSLRKSMSKYESENTKLDVLAYSKYQPCFLNRQLITLLSTLGVRDAIFEKKQEEVVRKLDNILTDPDMALEAVEIMSPGETTNIIKEMILCGYKPDAEPFLSMLLQTFRAKKLFDLQTKSRIFLPKGRAMIGCLDETRTLEYGQVFVQVSCLGNTQFHESGLSMFHRSESDKRTVVLRGTVIVAKNPCLHPGDVRILSAVDIPYLHHMVDCVVFPQKGKRPHPNECSGSDLDGDVYFVSWDSELIPPNQIQPMEYTPAPTETLDHEVTIEEVEVYFTDYILNDSLGIIANAHTVFADKEPLKANSAECIELARLFSIAVDFPKTGVPAVIPSDLRVKECPDFMEKPDKVTYISKGVIGKLFRAVKEHSSDSTHIKAFTKDVARRTCDPDMEVEGFMDYVNDAASFKEDYDFKLGNLLDHYGIKTEAEIIGGNIIRMSKYFKRYKDVDAIGLAVRSLRKEARGWFNEKSIGHGLGEGDVKAKASAWYHVTYHPSYWGCYNEDLKRPHFLSFPWCVYDKLIQIKEEKIRRRRMDDHEVLLLQRKLGRGFAGLSLN